MRNFLINNSLIGEPQHGYMPKRSVATNLLQCDENIVRNLHANEPCGLILLDFTRAFDKVSHDILKVKLNALGITGNLYQWLADFLKKRTQFVMCYGVESVPVPVTSGVVQGSVAGPLLFAIMINDLAQQATSLDIVLYADDVKGVGRACSKQDCKRFQDDLDAIYNWSLVNRLPLSLPKCMCLHLGHNNMRHMYSLGGAPLMAVDQCTDLGLIRTSDFMYNTHIYSIISKASRTSGMLFRAFSTRNKAFILKLYVAYVRPILECISVAWNPIGIGLESDIEKVQQTFTKRLCGSNFNGL